MRKSIIDPLFEFFDLTGRAIFSFELSKRWFVAVMYGLVCHVIFSVSVLSMILAMFWGMSQSFGKVPYPWSHIANLILLLQFPLAHSFLLSSKEKVISFILRQKSTRKYYLPLLLHCWPLFSYFVILFLDTV